MVRWYVQFPPEVTVCEYQWWRATTRAAAVGTAAGSLSKSPWTDRAASCDSHIHLAPGRLWDVIHTRMMGCIGVARDSRVALDYTD